MHIMQSLAKLLNHLLQQTAFCEKQSATPYKTIFFGVLNAEIRKSCEKS